MYFQFIVQYTEYKSHDHIEIQVTWPYYNTGHMTIAAGCQLSDEVLHCSLNPSDFFQLSPQLVVKVWKTNNLKVADFSLSVHLHAASCASPCIVFVQKCTLSMHVAWYHTQPLTLHTARVIEKWVFMTLGTQLCFLCLRIWKQVLHFYVFVS